MTIIKISGNTLLKYCFAHFHVQLAEDVLGTFIVCMSLHQRYKCE